MQKPSDAKTADGYVIFDSADAAKLAQTQMNGFDLLGTRMRVVLSTSTTEAAMSTPFDQGLGLPMNAQKRTELMHNLALAHGGVPVPTGPPLPLPTPTPLLPLPSVVVPALNPNLPPPLPPNGTSFPNRFLFIRNLFDPAK